MARRGAAGAGTGGHSGSGGGGSGGGGGSSGSSGSSGAGGTASAGHDGGAGAGGSRSDAGGKGHELRRVGLRGQVVQALRGLRAGHRRHDPDGVDGAAGIRAHAASGTVLAKDAAHSGSMSLKASGMSTGLDRVQRALASLGPTATKHWGRLFYKVGTPTPKPTSGVIYITMAALEGTTENRVVDTVVAMNGTHQWLFNILDDPRAARARRTTGRSRNAWHCAEWNIDVATSSFRFFSDGQEVTQLTFTGKTGARMSAYKSIGLGTIYYQMPPAPIVMWFDDLAIDDNRVGCL